ncbi:hypothetical protein HFO56_42790 [Rhizobium laguerreae]|uniref:hypothetical protein n=1 Tax=Rhizobium laguerreae TaxID=1076926 RepID=UPI001C90392F|nr:hypothetical protein [Rhizobium laguerreae]MBY3158999.1 hypothetical protein [Rhizobium laguerreae]
MTIFNGPPTSADHNEPIAPELRDVLRRAEDAAGIDPIDIISGGQPKETAAIAGARRCAEET